MNRIDQLLMSGSRFRVVLGLVLTLLFAVYATLVPGHRYIALFFTLLGLVGTWRQYQLWRRKAASPEGERLGPG